MKATHNKACTRTGLMRHDKLARFSKLRAIISSSLANSPAGNENRWAERVVSLRQSMRFQDADLYRA